MAATGGNGRQCVHRRPLAASAAFCRPLPPSAAPIRNRLTAPWQLEIVPTKTSAAEPLSPAARTSASFAVDAVLAGDALVRAHEQGRPMHRLARRPQPLRQTAHGVPHLPRPRAPDGRADGGLDAVGGTDPVG